MPYKVTRMEHNGHILIVDDDPSICELVTEYLQQYAYKMSIANNGQQMWKALENEPIDLIILDITMPGEDGLTLCRKLRHTSSIPILILSAADEEADRILGLEIGADDYLTKPFSSRELLARVKALLRRSTYKSIKTEAHNLATMPKIHFAGWTLDLYKRCLHARDGKIIPLTNLEYELLVAFVQHPEEALSRDQLMDLTTGKEADIFDRSIDVLVGRLRKKIETDPKQPRIIATVRGYGYQLDTPVTREA